MIERRAYGPKSTPEEIALIRQRIQPHSAEVVLLREMPVQSLFQVGIFEERLYEITRNMRSFGLLVDLTEADFPSAEVRTRLKKMFGSFPAMRAIGVFTGRNFLINTAAKYILSEHGLPPFDVLKTREEALDALARRGVKTSLARTA